MGNLQDALIMRDFAAKQKEFEVVEGEPNSEQWYAARSTGIGASEAAAAIGVSKWSTPLEVYHRKRGNLPEKEQNDAMRLGHKLEPIVLSEWWEANRQYYDEIVTPVGMLRSNESPFALATPDAIARASDVMHPMECKTTSWRLAKSLDEDAESLPIEWQCQAQQQMYVMGMACVIFPVLIDGRTLKTYEVERDDDMIETIVAGERELWRRIVEGDEPEATYDHRSTADLLKKLNPHITEGKRIELSAGAVSLYEKVKRINEHLKRLEKLKSAWMNEIAAEMGDVQSALCGDTVLTRTEIKPQLIKEHTRAGYVRMNARKRKPND